MQYSNDYKVDTYVRAIYNKKVMLLALANIREPKLLEHCIRELCNAQSDLDIYKPMLTAEDAVEIEQIVGKENVSF